VRVHSSDLLELVLKIGNEVVFAVLDLFDRTGDHSGGSGVDIGGL
jgi:hypothetical protein